MQLFLLSLPKLLSKMLHLRKKNHEKITFYVYFSISFSIGYIFTIGGKMLKNFHNYLFHLLQYRVGFLPRLYWDRIALFRGDFQTDNVSPACLLKNVSFQTFSRSSFLATCALHYLDHTLNPLLKENRQFCDVGFFIPTFFYN